MRRLAILNSKYDTYSETFIHHHVTGLPFDTYLYHGQFPIHLNDNPTPLNRGLSKVFYRFLGQIRGIRNLDYHIALANSFRENKIDAVLAEYGHMGTKGLWAASKLGIPLFVHFHGFDISKQKILESNDYYRSLAPYVSAFFVVSKEMHETALEIGLPEEKIVRNVYGPSDDFLRVSPVYDTQNFVAVGRFTDKKAPQKTISAFNLVHDKFPEAKLSMVGEGDLLQECQELVDSLGITDAVSFKGILNRDSIMKLMESSIALVQHSVQAPDGDKEGTPLAILEAQAASLPVISTYHAGIPDVVINDTTGFLVPEGDVQGMADSMSKLLSNPSMAKSMGAAGRQRVLENFTLNRHLEKITNEINRSLDERETKV